MKWFLQVLKNYANFNGRARRKEYWMFVLIYMIIYIPLSMLAVKIPAINILTMILSLGLIIPSIAVGVRRMHDVGKSGWFLLIPIYSFILACTNGEVGTNQYGPDPKAEGTDISDHLIS